jgi:hypothetical protein
MIRRNLIGFGRWNFCLVLPPTFSYLEAMYICHKVKFPAPTKILDFYRQYITKKPIDMGWRTVTAKGTV